MRRLASVRLATLLAVIVLLALVVPAGPFGVVRAEIPHDCRFHGIVTVVGTRVDAGTEITVSLDPDPVVGPSWTTTTFLHRGVPYYVIDIPMEDLPEQGGVEGDTVYFTVTGVTYEGNSFTANLSGSDGTWRMARRVRHDLHVGTPGDVNMDGVVDDDDIEMLKLILRPEHLGGLPETPSADVNQDGVVNVLDLIKLRGIVNPGP